MAHENITIKNFGYSRVNNDEQPLAIGAYGKVIIIKEDSSNKIFAMKIINKEILRAKNSQLLDLIYNEINIHSSLDHPNIVKLQKWFEDDTRIFMVLEYCNGGTLSKKIDSSLNETEVYSIFSQICLGVEYLHNNSIIHRDLKPLNVLLTKKGEVKICDFGWSCLGYESFTRNLPGTVLYMSPEIINKENHSYPCDIWSLGVMLYEITQQTTPFCEYQDYKSTHNIIENIKNNKRKDFKKSISSKLKDLIKKSLKVNQDQRPTIAELFQESWMQKFSHKGDNVETSRKNFNTKIDKNYMNISKISYNNEKRNKSKVSDDSP